MTYIFVSFAAMLVGVLIGTKFEAATWQLAHRKLIADLKQERAKAVLKAFQRGLTMGRMTRYRLYGANCPEAVREAQG